MTSAIKHNLVTFLAGDPHAEAAPRLYLTLASAWKLSTGLRPNINSAKVSYKELDKLDGVYDAVGSIEFWFNNEPGGADENATAPDFQIDGVRIVQIRPTQMRVPFGEEEPRAVEFELYFADFREQYIEPRGGRLRLGLINAGGAPPEGDDTGEDFDGTEMSLAELIGACLDVMGVTAGVPVLPTNAAAPRKLRWFGNHAPTELAKLLELARCVFVPGLDGKGSVQLLTSQGTPPFPQSAVLLPEIVIPSTDRRGKFVVFGSYPTRVTLTQTMSGPDDAGWFYAVRDRSTGWSPIDHTVLMGGTTPAAQMAAHFTGVDEKFRNTLATDAYCCIQLNKNVLSPLHSPVLNRVIEGDLTDSQIYINAIVAVQDLATGLWANTAAAIDIPVKAVLKDENILVSPVRLMTVTGPTADPLANFAGPATFNVRFSAEKATRDTDTGKWTPDYFNVGYFREAGVITEMSPDDIANALDGKGGSTRDTLTVSRPEMRLMNVDDSDSNTADLKAAALELADTYLQDVQYPIRQLSAQGFVAMTPSGLVGEVAWDQSRLITHLKVNDWYAIEGVMAGHQALLKAESGGGGGGGGSGASGGAYPHQARMEASRAELGECGSVTPLAPLNLADQPNAVAAPTSGFSVYFGTLTADWAPGNNTVVLTPCRSATDATATGDPNVTAQIQWPVGYAPPCFAAASGDVLAYAKSGTINFLLNPAILPLPDQAYRVFTATAPGNAKWDWVKAHS